MCLTPVFSPPLALLAGILFSLVLKHPFPIFNKGAISKLLQISIVGLGFGINLYDAAEAGKKGLWLTVTTIGITLALGLIAAKIFRLNKNISFLISAGTAICGGSAIAAISPVIKAKEEEISISLAAIFILNAIALFIFPLIGQALVLTQEQFGMWAAVSIHDTSSVVGAAQTYGTKALHIATTVKLERALWIIPLSLAASFISKKGGTLKLPYFILLFVLAMAVNSFVPQFHEIGSWIVAFSKKGMTLTLFFIGAGLSITSIREVGIKPLLLAIGLWILIAIGSLGIILADS